jgi:hypothetical protein
MTWHVCVAGIIIGSVVAGVAVAVAVIAVLCVLHRNHKLPRQL